MRRLLAAAGPFYVVAGLLHFVIPQVYERIMPPWLPWHRELVYASGVAEIAGGVALMSPNPDVRRYGGYFQAATMAGVFPANVDMCFREKHQRTIPGGLPTLIARLPLQLGFVAWALAAGRRAG